MRIATSSTTSLCCKAPSSSLLTRAGSQLQALPSASLVLLTGGEGQQRQVHARRGPGGPRAVPGDRLRVPHGRPVLGGAHPRRRLASGRPCGGQGAELSRWPPALCMRSTVADVTRDELQCVLHAAAAAGLYFCWPGLFRWGAPSSPLRTMIDDRTCCSACIAAVCSACWHTGGSGALPGVRSAAGAADGRRGGATRRAAVFQGARPGAHAQNDAAARACPPLGHRQCW